MFGIGGHTNVKSNMQFIIPQLVSVIPVDMPLNNQELDPSTVQLLSVAAHQASDSDVYFQCCCDNWILSLHLLTEYFGIL